MWKITKLYLKNFIHIYSGMNKREVEIDLTKSDKRINIFIGKMGSSKSSILGHLQPFSTYGSLDVRNTEDLIIPEEDGEKRITYIHEDHVYEIKHVYTWNKHTASHNTKSYIKLDGKELNENGNVSSFKELIKLHFGIDQNFLRLLRLGPNVSNVINMKSADRKAFIASLLKDTEIYIYLYKKLNEELRGMNSALSILSNKLISLSADKEESIKGEEESLKEEIGELVKDIDEVKGSISRLKGMNQVLAGGNQDLEEKIEEVESDIKKKKDRIQELTDALNQIPNDDVQSISFRYGEITTKINSYHEEIENTQYDIEQKKIEINKLKDFILIHDSDEHLGVLRREVKELEKNYKRMMIKLSDFHSHYNYNYLQSILSQLDNLQILMDEMASYNPKVIMMCYESGREIKGYCGKKISMLNGALFNKHKQLDNIEYAKDYQCPIPLYRPPMCPTVDCPFVLTHPEYIRRNGSSHQNERMKLLRDEIQQCENDIAIYQDCISQYPRMLYLKEEWAKIYPILSNVGALNIGSLKRILLDLNARSSWYSRDILMGYIEKLKLQEDSKDLVLKLHSMQEEINQLSGGDITEKKTQLGIAEEYVREKIKRLEEIDVDLKKLEKERSTIEKALEILQNREIYQLEKVQLDTLVNSQEVSLVEMRGKLSKYKDNRQNISILESRETMLSLKHNELSEKYTKIVGILQDIKSTKADYETYVQERDELKMILEAVSAKEGIPLVMVKVFLKQCKDIINELISDIFEDDLEIVEFNISESNNEFRIPYTINGQYVPDIEFASQGQQAVISIALSFALCRKSMFDYNIMLLDEIDNSIHKSDRERFIMILSKQMQAIHAEQVFLITHNDIFQQSGLPVNILMTTNEIVDTYKNQSVMRLYE